MSLDEPPTDYMFLPFLQNYNGQLTMLLHTTGDPEHLAASLRSVVNVLDEQLPVYGVKTMPQYLDRVLSQPKSIAAMVGLFGFLGLLLAAVGLYGVMSYAIAQRTREIGVRMALGARPRDVLKLVLRQGMLLLLIGIGVGLIGAFALTRLLKNLLYGVSPTDPMTFAVIVLLLTGVALVACLVPARRATKVDPMVALRYE
jgi:putative ABC transport system permease protein